jgi:hypothetical protein
MLSTLLRRAIPATHIVQRSKETRNATFFLALLATFRHYPTYTAWDDQYSGKSVEGTLNCRYD